MATKKKKVLTVKDINKLFISSMKKIAKALDKPSCEVTMAEFFANDPADLSEWDIRKAGGFSSLKKLYFPAEENIEVKYGARLVSSFRNKIEKTNGLDRFISNEVLTAIKEVLDKQKFHIHKPVKTAKKGKKKRTIIAHLSDLHYGCKISDKEMGGVNSWDWTIAARRTAFYMQQVVDYKPQHRKDTDLIVSINGDIIAGVIHNQEWFAEPLATQFAGALSTLSQAIGYAAQHFDKIKVVCTVGNHGRAMHKSSRDRASVHKWDSYETLIYIALREMLQGKYKNVTVDVPESPYAILDVQGHKFFQTHGDTVFNVGNVGKSLNMDGIHNQIAKLNASKICDKKFSAILVGHAHVPLFYLTDNGCVLFVNGCLIGTDPFAQSIGIHKSQPAQWIFEATDKHPVGDQRLIKVTQADDMKELDAIIKPFEGTF
jgi:hypothetical protein